MRTHNTRVSSSIPLCVTIKTPLVRKATRNHLIKSTSLEKLQSSHLWFLLRLKSSMRRSFLGTYLDRDQVMGNYVSFFTVFESTHYCSYPNSCPPNGGISPFDKIFWQHPQLGWFHGLLRLHEGHSRCISH